MSFFMASLITLPNNQNGLGWKIAYPIVFSSTKSTNHHKKFLLALLSKIQVTFYLTHILDIRFLGNFARHVKCQNKYKLR